MINVLIVDDSAFVRDFLSKILSQDRDINVADKAQDPYKAVEILNKRRDIDVITLDLEMPRMDGLTFLKKLMVQKPMPVVVCSSIAEEGSDNAIKALELGAVEVITKPKYGLKDFFEEEKAKIQDAVKSAAKANMSNLRETVRKQSVIRGGNSIAKPKSQLLSQTTNKVIAIGASTGGTVAIRDILFRLPKTCTGIIVTQHMPEGFTKSFANSLNLESQLDVKELEEDDKISIGTAIIARGNRHLTVSRSGAYYYCNYDIGPQVNRHRPSVDVMFKSVAEKVGKNALGILLTGMGRDGADGLMAIREAGGTTIAQNEASCVVYGMPKAAVDIGAADYILNLDEIVQMIVDFHD